MDMDYHIRNRTLEHWIPIHYLTRLRNNYRIEYEEIEREDEYFQLGQFVTDFITSYKPEL